MHVLINGKTLTSLEMYLHLTTAVGVLTGYERPGNKTSSCLLLNVSRSMNGCAYNIYFIRLPIIGIETTPLTGRTLNWKSLLFFDFNLTITRSNLSLALVIRNSPRTCKRWRPPSLSNWASNFSLAWMCTLQHSVTWVMAIKWMI